VTARRVALLLGKDLRVLGRSPLLLLVLVAYPLAIAALVALVASFAADKPRVAFVDQDGLPEQIVIGGQEFEVRDVLEQVEAEVDLIHLEQEEADERLASGDIVAQIIVPPGFASRLRGMTQSPTLILRTSRGGLSGRVERQTEALVFNLNRRLQDAYIQANLDYVELLQEGGTGTFLGNEFEVLGLDRAAEILDSILARPQPPEIQGEAEELRDFIDEAQLALDQTGASLRATANPIELRAEDAERRERLLSTQLQAYALALTLAIVCILLAAAGIAVERDENVVGRLARGLVRLGELVSAKIALALVVGTVFGLGLAIVFAGALDIAGEGSQPWGRLPLLVLGLALAAAAFGAFGTLIGVLAREARTASLVALLVAVPILLLGFLPEASVAPATWVSRAFPFSHAVTFFQSALYDLDPWRTLAVQAAWLAGLLVIFAAGARLGVRRLTA
jgi:ABC-type multidrug transport system permease subunit